MKNPQKSIKSAIQYNKNVQTLIGTTKKVYMDCDTGEYIHVDQINKRIYGQKSFWKVYLMDFLAILGIIDSKQLDVFIYIAENTDQATNLFIGTYRKIATDLNVSTRTVSLIIKKLKDNNFIQKVQNGVWMVNPNIMMKGNDTKRQILLTYFQGDENEISMTRGKAKQLTPEPEINPDDYNKKLLGEPLFEEK